MKLPRLERPERMAGLYIFDFGEWTAVGYTAEEIAILLESEQYADGKIFKIHRVSPDGQMELRGISRSRFSVESGMFFFQDELEAARRDFEELQTAAEQIPPPCRAFLHLADRHTESRQAFVTALIYPAEYDDEISRWLTQIAYNGGVTVEGGVSHVADYYQEANTPLERQQLWSRPAITSRSAEEVLAKVRNAVQRPLGGVA